ncbi:MAG TPA: hypothetical protein VHV79_09455 [Mycobacteriales bacterium]|jgi:hypothetical protein|nr:hypothetical protein [Mycobacteriales bacterium]
MRTSRARTAGALLTGLGAALLIAAPTGAVAAQHSHATSSKKPAHPAGLFVSEQGRITKAATPSAFLRDFNSTQHIVTSVASTTPGKSRVVYLTRRSKAGKWTSHAIPGLRPSAGKIQIEAHLSPDGRHVYVVFYECDGVFASAAGINAVRLPEPTQITATTNTCGRPNASNDNPPIARSMVFPYNDMGVLLPDPAQDNKIALWKGLPNTGFVPGAALPTTDGFTPVQITTGTSGQVVVIGTGMDGANQAIYTVMKDPYGSTWSAPVKLATLNSPTSDYTIEALTSYRYSTWVGLYRPRGSSGRTHTLFLDHGTASGWLGVVPMAHTTTHDSSLRLVYNEGTGHLHAAFTRVDPASKSKKSGIMQQTLIKSWAKPKFVTHWYRDVAAQLTFTNGGHTILSYYQP